jgi:hypothetical protein
MASQPGGFVDKSFEPRTLDEHDLSRGLRVSTGHIDRTNRVDKDFL